MNNDIKWGVVIRDVVIIWILIVLAPLFSAMITLKSFTFLSFVVLAAIILGFTISGYRTKINRWKHLFCVALGVWLVIGFVVCLLPSMYNSYSLGINVWFISFIIVLFIMSIGGVLASILSGRGNVSETTDIKNMNVDSNDSGPNVDHELWVEQRRIRKISK